MNNQFTKTIRRFDFQLVSYFQQYPIPNLKMLIS